MPKSYAMMAFKISIILLVYLTDVPRNVGVDGAEIEDGAPIGQPTDWYKTREMWRAKNYSDPEVHVEEPLRLVILTDTTSTRCNRFLTCAAEIRQLQSYYHTNFQYDIPYNFLIGNDGRVYEGRGWRVAGDHTKGYNNCSLGLAFIGNYAQGWPGTSRVRDIQIQRAQLLFEEGIKLGHLSSDFHVLAAKDLVKTLKPGNNLYREIRAMANYDHENRYKNHTCEEIQSL